ncbi:MAG: hypothetical protein M9900_00885 [Flavobacteriales bacterium]|nr:hypothetical protein [Flavobacteriales bacterium]
MINFRGGSDDPVSTVPMGGGLLKISSIVKFSPALSCPFTLAPAISVLPSS